MRINRRIDLIMKKQYTVNEITKLVWKNIITIVIFMLIGALAAGLYAKHKKTTVYMAKTNVLVGHNLNYTNYKNSTVLADLNMVSSYKDMINDPQVMNQAKKNLPKKLRHHYSAKDIAGDVSVDTHPQSLVLSIKAKAKSPRIATEMVNATSKATHQELPKMSPNVGEVKPLAKARVKDAGSSTTPSTKKYVVLGAALGILAGMLASFAVTTWKKIL